MYFRFFVISFPWEKGGVFHLNKHESTSPICPVVLEKKIFKKFVHVFSLFRNYFPLEERWGLSFEKTWNHITHFPSCSREEDFLNLVNVFSLFRNYLLLEIRWGLSFEQTWVLITRGCNVPSLTEIGPVVVEKKIF